MLTDVRRSYLDQAAIGYLMYMVGAITAFLAAALALSDAEAGLHSSAMAAGMILAALLGRGLDHRIGVRISHFAGVGLGVVSALIMVWAPSFAVSLAGALGAGMSCGLVLGHVNAAVSLSGGVRALLQFTRSTFVAMILSVTVPIIIGLGIALGVGWRFAAAPVFVLFAIAAWANHSRQERPRDGLPVRGRLPRDYWLPWVLTILVVSLEFGILFWASTVVERSTGVSLADATLTISVYIGGIILGRAALSTAFVGGHDPVWLLRGALTVTLAGSVLVWLAPDYAFAAGAMFVLGLGLGWLYPICGSITLATAPQAPTLAATRLVLASGLAILLAPFLLGLVADVTGVVTAWLLLPVTALASIALTVPVAHARRRMFGGAWADPAAEGEQPRVVPAPDLELPER